jgi:hypothetical protein
VIDPKPQARLGAEALRTMSLSTILTMDRGFIDAKYAAAVCTSESVTALANNALLMVVPRFCTALRLAPLLKSANC